MPMTQHFANLFAVPYTHRLKTGKTVIQHFYDAHYDGAATTQTFVTQWSSLKGKIDTQRFEDVLFRQKFQAVRTSSSSKDTSP